MKYFTNDWHFGNLKDKEVGKISKNYWKYIDKIYDTLPFALKILSKNISLHDGILKKLTYFSNRNELILEGIFGDLQIGYFFLKIKYLNLINFDIQHLKNIYSNGFIQILSDEIELLFDKRYCHRMFFSNKNEFEINFSSIELEIIDAISNDYNIQNCLLKIE
jgi:hypothetical protein